MALVNRGVKEAPQQDAKESKQTVLPYALSILNNWPAGHFFRKYVDGKLQLIYKGKQGYEAKEPNSSKGMMRGIAFLLNNSHRKRNSAFLKELHKVVFSDVTLSSGQRSNDVASPGQFRNNHTHIPIGHHNTSLEGLLELCEKIAFGQSKGCIIYFDREQHLKAMKEGWEGSLRYYEDKIKNRVYLNKDNYTQQATDIFKRTQKSDPADVLFAYIPFIPKNIFFVREEIDSLVDAALDRYNKKLGSFDAIFEMVDHVADIGAELECQIHPFVDGNCRVIDTLLVNDGLMQMGIPFSCLFDPNRFDFFSKKQMVNEIFKGINITLHAFIEPARSYYRFNPASLVDYSRHVCEESTFMKANTRDITDSEEFKSSELNQLRLLTMRAKKKTTDSEELKLNQARLKTKFEDHQARKETLAVTVLKKRHPHYMFFTYGELHRFALLDKNTQRDVQPIIGEIEAQAYSLIPKKPGS